jgi:hypothetical protein
MNIKFKDIKLLRLYVGKEKNDARYYFPFKPIVGNQFLVMFMGDIFGIGFMDKDNMPSAFYEIGGPQTLMHWLWEQPGFPRKWSEAWDYYLEQQ